MAGEAIFIGYRRDDTADVAGRIYDAMALRFGKGRVFKDVDNIGPGVDFGDYIKSVLPKCRVALMLIGPHWLESKDEDGNRRLDYVHDWVRIEIETALSTPDVLTVPVLVNGARMPRASDVPESLRPLLRRNAAIIRRDPDFHDDVERLAAALRASVNTGILDLSKIGGQSIPAGSAPRASGASRAPMMIAAALALVAAGYGAWRFLPGAFSLPPAEQGAESSSEPDTAPGEIGSVVSPSRARQPASAPPTQNEATTPPIQTRVEEPVRAPPSAGALPEMVRIPGRNFEVGRYEVTFAQWDACVAGGGCNGYTPSDHGWGRGNRPVINVSWNDAQAYVQWLSQRTGRRYRLLSSAEWEFAVRGDAATNFSWGDQDPVCDRSARNGANFGACADQRTLPVGSFQPNAFGLYDLHGNVGEWVEDCAPRGCSNRMARGGTWLEGLRPITNDNWPTHSPASPTYRSIYHGFRIARTT